MDDLAAFSLRPWLIFAGSFAVCNLAYGLLLELLDRADAELLMFLLTGCVVAEAGILPAWLVWGRGPLWQRLPWHVGIAFVLFVLWYLGMLVWHLRSYDDRVQVPAMILFSLPAVSVAVSAPLWLVRLFFGWRIVPRDDLNLANERLSIRDFLVGMAVVGVALASARLAMAIGKPPEEWQYWLALGIAVAAAAAAGLFLELPLLWFTFRFRSYLPSGIAVGATMLVAWVILITIVTAVDRRIPDGRVVAGICLFLLSLGYTTAAAFWLARADGYRLEIPGRDRR